MNPNTNSKPYMPNDPQLYHAYVPYQLDVKEFALDQILNKGTLYVSLYSAYDGTTSGDEVLC